MGRFRFPANVCPLLLCLCAVGTFAQQPTDQQNSGAAMPSVHLPSGHSDLTSPINNAMVKTDSAPAGELPPPVPAGRPTIALVLAGGGALGLAHIGVLKWLEEHRIPVDRLTGTSMGSLIGALYATGHSADEIEQVAEGAELQQIFHVFVNYDDLSYRRREDRREMPGIFRFGLKNGIGMRTGLLTDRELNDFLHDEFQNYNGNNVSYDNLPIPFRCVATDLNTLHPVVFYGGSIPLAVRASISIPGVFSPVKYHGHYLVDGAVMQNMPTETAKDDLRPDVIIAVSLPSANFADSDVSSIVGVFARTFSASTARNERDSAKLANVLLEPKTGDFSSGDYGKVSELVTLGYAAAEKEKAALLKYQLSPEAWQQYLAAKQSRRYPAPGNLEVVRIEGGTRGAQENVQQQLDPLKGQPIRTKRIFQALIPVQSNQTYEAQFTTTSSAPPDTRGHAPSDGVLVDLEPTRDGPPFLLLGADITAMTSNVTRTSFDMRLLNTDLGGYGSELRTDLRIGFLTQASTEYYRLLKQNGLFVQPRLGLLRQPVYIYRNQKRVAERFQQNAGGGLDLGRTYRSRAQLAIEWNYERIRWSTQSGDDGYPDLSGTAQSGALRYTYNSLNNSLLATRGVYLDASLGALYHALDSENAPILRLNTIYAKQLSGPNILGINFSGDTYFRRNVADPLRFTLGGPNQLSASSVDEYRGTDDLFLRLSYYRRLATLPTQLGDGLYLQGSYESGAMWSPDIPSFVRQDGALGILAATPFGAITLGGAIGDAGHRKFFFTFGRLF